MTPYLMRKELMLFALALIAMIFLTTGAFHFRKTERTLADVI